MCRKADLEQTCGLPRLFLGDLSTVRLAVRVWCHSIVPWAGAPPQPRLKDFPLSGSQTLTESK